MRVHVHFVLIAALGAAGCGAGEAAAPKTPTAVRVRAVERSSTRNATRYSANIKPASRVDVAFKVGGYVQRVATVKGVDGKPRVCCKRAIASRRGQELARCAAPTTSRSWPRRKRRLAEAQAAREQAQIDFDRADAAGRPPRASPRPSSTTRASSSTASARASTAPACASPRRRPRSATPRLRAPMNGVVVKRNVELGTLAAPGTVALLHRRHRVGQGGLRRARHRARGAAARHRADGDHRGLSRARVRRAHHAHRAGGRSQEPRLRGRGHHPQRRRRAQAGHGRRAASSSGAGAAHAADGAAAHRRRALAGPRRPLRRLRRRSATTASETPPVARCARSSSASSSATRSPSAAGLGDGDQVVVRAPPCSADGEQVEVIP